jgi:crotonobetainyl-CoA:carnitine CoA-transferase CaiB-like acyl-CoA transferase
MAKPLNGVRILDLTHMLSGPYGAMILADLGAETIKVEPLKGRGHAQAAGLGSAQLPRRAGRLFHHAQPQQAERGRWTSKARPAWRCSTIWCAAPTW